MRLNWAAVPYVYRLRKHGNKRAHVMVNIPAFLEGYNLFESVMTADLRNEERMFKMHWKRREA